MRVLLVILSFALSGADFSAPKYVVDLDAPATERWSAMAEDLIARHGFANSFGPILDYLTSHVAPLAEFKKADKEIQLAGLALFGLEYIEEIRGIVTTAGKLGYGDNVTTGMLVFVQLFYEVAMECTGIVAEDASGKVAHGRNMDIGIPITNITAQVTWIRGGKEVITSTQFIGYFGIHTGMRLNHGWSVQANLRVLLQFGPWGYQKTAIATDLLDLLLKHKLVGYFLREALLEYPNYTEAVSGLASAKTASPLYLIVAGPEQHQGAVITKNRDGLAYSPDNTSIWSLNGEDSWYRVQTNWDHWMPLDREQCSGAVAALPSPVQAACAKVAKLLYGSDGGCVAFCQLTSDGRREAALAEMGKLQKNDNSFSSLMKVLSKPPVLATDTAFTSLMRPSTDEYQTTVRSHEDDAANGVLPLPENEIAKKTEDFFIEMFRRLIELGHARGRAEVIVV